MKSNLKYGIINSIDHSKGFATVRFEDLDFLTHPIPFAMPCTDKDKVYFPFEEGTQVACIMDDNFEDGLIVGAIYSNEDTTPAGAAQGVFIKKFEDGTIFKYDKNTNEYSIKNGTVEFVVSRTGGFKISKGADDLKSILNDVLAQIQLITVVASGFGAPTSVPANAAAFATISTRVNAFFNA